MAACNRQRQVGPKEEEILIGKVPEISECTWPEDMPAI
jgi:hypothetical protein